MMRIRSRWCESFGVALLLFTVVRPAAAQLQLAAVALTVVDHQGAPVGDAVVLLNDPLGAEVQRVVTDAGGRGAFASVAPGRYQVETRAAGAVPFELPLHVSGALPIDLTIRVPAGVTDAVAVEGARAEEPSSRGSIAGESLARVVARARGRALQDAVATLPGWSTEDNGLLHARGVDDGFLYVIDGVPVYERLDALFGLAPDLTALSGINVITGYVPPEFGHKAGGVIEVRSASARPDWGGLGELRLGGDVMRDGALVAGGRLAPQARLRVGTAAARSDRFLDPVHPANLHNRGGQASAFGELEWAAAADRLTVGWGFGRSRFDVPNTEDQEEVGQDQRQSVRQGYVNTTWQRAWSSQTVTQATLYHRRTFADLQSHGPAVPLTAEADRELVRSGGLLAVTRQHRSHLLKAGLEYQRLSLDEAFSFAITDEEEAREAEFRDEALVFTLANPFVFSGRATPTIWSVYAQDSWLAAPRVTMSGGIRFDRSTLLLTRSQWSPRAGVAVRVSDDTVVRASASRFYQPPQPEHLLLSSSPEARVLSAIRVGDAEGGADVEPERQWATEVGVEQQLGRRLRLDAAYWQRRVEHAADPNVFAGTTIIFPNAVARGRARGFDARLEVSRHRGWSAYVNASAASVVQTGPITGGLFLEDEVEELGPGAEFTPDHDQRFTAGGGVTWEHASSRALVSLTVRHETGTPIQQEEDDLDELMDSPGAEMVDFDAGRVKPRTVISLLGTLPVFTTGEATGVVGLQVLNLFDQRFAYNFGNPFSGTHFGAPRTVALTLRVTFR